MQEIPKKIEHTQELIRWFIKFRLQSGLEECYPISTSEKERLWENLPRLCEEKGINFFDFYSENHCIFVQTSQITFFQFLFEPLCITHPQKPDNDNEDAENAYAVKIYFLNDPNPTIFHVDIDEPNLFAEDNQGEIRNFLFYASHICYEEEWVKFATEDGEIAFFRGASIALAEIPLKVLQEQDVPCDEAHLQWSFQSNSVH